ncbi:MAG: c-type cytochrome [Woeseia sp.]
MRDSLRFRKAWFAAGLVLLVVAISGCESRESANGTAARDAGTDAAAMPAERQADKRNGAFGGTLDGREIYDKSCASCHDAGFNGAPRLSTRSDWVNLDAVGADGYTQITIAGIGIMPPRGGQPDMTDEQVRAVVDFMLSEIR